MSVSSPETIKKSPLSGVSTEAAAESNAISLEQMLPAIRSELILSPQDDASSGNPTWTLYDPVKARYFRIGWLQFELLSRWHLYSKQAVIDSVNTHTTLMADTIQLDSFIHMLAQSELLTPDTTEKINELAAKLSAPKATPASLALSHSMFYRRRLINPDQLLATINRVITPLYHHKKTLLTLWAIWLAILLPGVSSHWFEFKSSFSLFASPLGLMMFGIALVMVNILHEFGHGLIAKRYHCRVTDMGIALIFMFPVCYCDTSDSWRLQQKQQRLLIGSGGLIAEAAIATSALTLWLLVPEGVIKSLLFFLTVTSLASSLLINLNPFMKFDGYYLLSDAMGVDNLQLKAFSHLRWQLRRQLLKSNEQRPYDLSKTNGKLVTAYAFGTWVYRFFLYLTICWLVYQFWFKALGLFLMAAVFCKMLILPVASELKIYATTLRTQKINVRSALSLLTLSALVALLIIPLPRKISAPAILGSSSANHLYAPASARIAEIHIKEGDKITRGDTLITLHDPELTYQLKKLTIELESLQSIRLQQTRWLAQNVEKQVSLQRIQAQQTALEEIQQQVTALTLTASDDAKVATLPNWLRPGAWVNENAVLATTTATDQTRVRAYIPGASRERLQPGISYFHTTDGMQIELTAQRISESNISNVQDKALTVPFGGYIAVQATNSDIAVPLQDWFQAELTLTDTLPNLKREQVGYVMFPAAPQSLALSAFDRITAVVIRESGF